MKMPVLFIGHGLPANIILKNNFTERLHRLGQELPHPKTILVVSAHWLTEGNWVTGMESPKTIFDFYGYPEEFYKVSYPCPGSPEVANSIADLIKKPSVKVDYLYGGLDSAVWPILKHIYPQADIPVIEMSLDYNYLNGWFHPSLQSYYELAKQLSPFREQGVLIIGSGNIVHNLREIDLQNIDAKPYKGAIEFDERVKRNLLEGNHKDLVNFKNLSQAMELFPSLDHYLPMIYAIALQDKDDTIEFIYEGFQNRSVSMRSFKIG
jgi:4,5-DOPA dioxygenase extradiol